MNWFDVFICVLLLWGLVRGFMKGFVIEFAMLIAILLGVWGAIHLSAYTATFLKTFIHTSDQNIKTSALAVTFLAIVIVIFLLAKLLESLLKLGGLGIPNRIAGALFGLFKYFIIAGVLVFILNKYAIPNEETKKRSVLYKPIAFVSLKVYPGLKDYFGESEN